MISALEFVDVLAYSTPSDSHWRGCAISDFCMLLITHVHLLSYLAAHFNDC